MSESRRAGMDRTLRLLSSARQFDMDAELNCGSTSCHKEGGRGTVAMPSVLHGLANCRSLRGQGAVSCARTAMIVAFITTILLCIQFASAASSSTCPSASSSPASLLHGSRAMRKDKHDAAANACLRHSALLLLLLIVSRCHISPRIYFT